MNWNRLQLSGHVRLECGRRRIDVEPDRQLLRVRAGSTGSLRAGFAALRDAACTRASGPKVSAVRAMREVGELLNRHDFRMDVLVGERVVASLGAGIRPSRLQGLFGLGSARLFPWRLAKASVWGGDELPAR